MEATHKHVLTRLGKSLYLGQNIELDDEGNPTPMSDVWKPIALFWVVCFVLWQIMGVIGGLSFVESSLGSLVLPVVGVLLFGLGAIAGPYYRLSFDMTKKTLTLTQTDTNDPEKNAETIPFKDLVIRRYHSGGTGGDTASYFIDIAKKTRKPEDMRGRYTCAVATVMLNDEEARVISKEIFDRLLSATGIDGIDLVEEG